MNNRDIAMRLVEAKAGKSHKVIRDFKSKSGVAFLKREPITVDRFGNTSVSLSTQDGRTIVLRLISAYKYVSGFVPPPSMDELGKMMNNGISTTATGDRVEPDGVGPNGAPSWIITLGMI